MFSAGRSPASLLLVCVPPRPTAAWLLLRSVVPYHSLFLLLLLRPGRQVRLLFLSTSLLSLGDPSLAPPSLFLTGYFDAQVSGFRYPSPAPPRLFLTGYFDAQVSAFRYPSPAPPRLLLTGYLDAQVSGFRCPSPALPRLFLAGYFDAQVSVFRYPIFFYQGLISALSFGVLDRLFRRPLFFPPNHTLPVAWVAGSLFVPPCCTPVFFTAPLWAGFFGGLCSSAALSLVAPHSSPTSGRYLWCRRVSGGPPFLTLFCTAWLTALGELPLISPVSLFVHFLHIRGPSIVSSFGCRDTGTACTAASLMGPFGNRKLGNLTYHRLLEVLSVYMLIEAWNSSIYREHGSSLW